MPVKTPHFGLEAFVRGDIYSSVIDRRRMITIDNHMNFISSIIGDGIIEGWSVTANGLTITITSGWGNIDLFSVRTFNDFAKTLPDNKKNKIYFRRRDKVIEGVGPFSNMKILSYVDSTPPSIPTNLKITNIATTFFTLSWDDVADFDFDVYDIYLSTNNIDFNKISSLLTSSFLVSDLNENTLYYIKVKSKDFSGNESLFSSTINIFTKKDISQPPDPIDVKIFNGDNRIQIAYMPPASNIINGYKITVTPISNINANIVGEAIVLVVNKDELNAIINNLTNFQKYNVLVQSISKNNILSVGSSLTAYPQGIIAPDEVESVNIISRPSINSISDIVISISWIPVIDPYNPIIPASYEIIIVENGDEGIIQSQPISILGTHKDVQLFPILENVITSDAGDGPGIQGNTINLRSIKSDTRYFIIIRVFDKDGNKSPGIFNIFHTNSFDKPQDPTVLTIIQRADQSLFIQWNNSRSEFDHNILKIIRIDTDLTVTDIINSINIGKTNFYSVDSSFVKSKSTFTFSVIAEDKFGNKSNELISTFFVPDINLLPLPPVPSQQIGTAGDRRSSISWSKPDVSYISGYRIWRSRRKVIYLATDFQIVETILDKDILNYDDFEVNNDTTYVYFITSMDIFGRESLNPIDNLFFDYIYVDVTPNTSIQKLNFPDNVSLSRTGVDITVTWDASTGKFDGYEIFKSIGNKYSFKKMGTVDFDTTLFFDKDAATKTGTIFYLVRKFINGADLFITDSFVSPISSLLIAEVSTSNGVATINLDNVRNIKDLSSPIKEEVNKNISVHKHRIVQEFGFTRDRRINLSDKLKISDWVADEIFRSYITLTNISEATTFTVLLDGSESSILFTLDKDRGLLTFEESLASVEGVNDVSFPFSSPPKVEVIFDNFSEVDGILESERVVGINAKQITSGTIKRSMFPVISHNGRLKEDLIPIQIPTVNIDEGYSFRPFSSQDEEFKFKITPGIDYFSIGSAVVFYDVCQARNVDGSLSDFLIAVTSDGFLTSSDFGVNWKRRRFFSTPGHKIFYSGTYSSYFVLTNKGVQFSRGISERKKTDKKGNIITEEFIDFSIFGEMSGTETTKIVRDIIESPNGSMWVSSDLGVYKLLVNKSRTIFFWQQEPIFGPSSTDMYAMLYDSYRSRVIVSNELGIFETFNDGILWEFSDEFPDQRPIFDFIQNVNGTIYAITDDIVWRRKIKDAMFERIYEHEDVKCIRKIFIWKNRLYISTDIGLLVSSKDFDINNDNKILFELAFPKMNIGPHIIPVTSLNIINNNLFVGTEKKLYVSKKPGRVSLHTDICDGIIPTIYINEIEQKIGYRFSTSTSMGFSVVTFDVKQKIDDIITIANQYKTYKIKNGGWADTKFDSNVILYLDGQKVNDGSIAESSIKSIDPPVPNPINNIVSERIFSNFDSLLEARNDLFGIFNDDGSIKKDENGNIVKVGSVNKISGLFTTDENGNSIPIVKGEYSPENINELFSSAERVLSQIYWKTDGFGDRQIVVKYDFAFDIEDKDEGKFTYKYYNHSEFKVAILKSPKDDISVSDLGLTSFGKYGSLTGTNGEFGSEFSGGN